jgi:hypothetical protein
MCGESESAILCRNYAEELRIIAADWSSADNRKTLLSVAEDYDRIADTYEAIDKSKRSKDLPR